MSRFATVKSEDARLDALGDAGQYGDVDESDPRSVARFMKRMGQEMGEDLGDDLDEAIEESLDEGAGGYDADGLPGDGESGGDDAGEL